MLEVFLSKQPAEYFQDLAEEIALDTDSDARLTGEQAALTIQDFLDSEALRNRGLFIKTKSWFGLLAPLKALVQNWTIQREAALAIVSESHGNADEQDDARQQEDDDAAAAAAAEAAAAPPKKWTKSELFKAYKGRGPHAMNADFLQDADLRSTAVLICHVTKPLQLACPSWFVEFAKIQVSCWFARG